MWPCSSLDWGSKQKSDLCSLAQHPFKGLTSLKTTRHKKHQKNWECCLMPPLLKVHYQSWDCCSRLLSLSWWSKVSWIALWDSSHNCLCLCLWAVFGHPKRKSNYERESRKLFLYKWQTQGRRKHIVDNRIVEEKCKKLFCWFDALASFLLTSTNSTLQRYCTQSLSAIIKIANDLHKKNLSIFIARNFFSSVAPRNGHKLRCW